MASRRDKPDKPSKNPAAKAGITAPNCPTCGQFMDKVRAWVCKRCGELKE